MKSLCDRKTLGGGEDRAQAAIAAKRVHLIDLLASAPAVVGELSRNGQRWLTAPHPLC